MKLTHRRINDNCNMILLGDNGFALFSYETLVLIRHNSTQYVDSYKYSSTTSRHINKCLLRHGDINYLSQEELQQKLQLLMTNQVLGI